MDRKLLRDPRATDTPELQHLLAEEWDVIGERNGLWVRFNQGITRAEAEERLTAFHFGSPNVTWRLIRRTTSTIEELIKIPLVE